jgi:hypothetical protein
MCWRANVEEHWSSRTEERRLVNAYLAGCEAGAR